MLVCVQSYWRRFYFDTSRVIDVEEPVDIETGRKPTAWADGVAAVVRLESEGGPVSVGFSFAEWPAVRQALGLDKAVVATQVS